MAAINTARIDLTLLHNQLYRMEDALSVSTIREKILKLNHHSNVYYSTNASNSEDAREKGKELHKNIESYYQYEGKRPKGYENDIAFKQFLNFEEYRKKELKWECQPYYSEFNVEDEECCITGRINMLFGDPNNIEGWIIVDWTRSRQDFQEPESKEGVKIQLNMYKYLFEKGQNVKITKMFLVQFNPDDENYKMHEISVIPIKKIEQYIHHCLVVTN